MEVAVAVGIIGGIGLFTAMVGIPIMANADKIAMALAGIL